MAPSSRTSSYYCELYDKTLVSNANLEEYKVGAIHSGLLEASGKMTKCQLQVFRKDLKTVHWGPLESAWILRHFRQKRIDIPDVVKDVVGLGCETTQELRMKKRNATLDGFRELLTDCVLIYEGVVVTILLHEFVPSDQAVEYFAAMVHMWEFGGHITKICSPETRMAMFGHRFCYNDCVPTR
ncbi:unnamed protein product [Sphagnum jensenii]